MKLTIEGYNGSISVNEAVAKKKTQADFIKEVAPMLKHTGLPEDKIKTALGEFHAAVNKTAPVETKK